jgi:hypothetical protein
LTRKPAKSWKTPVLRANRAVTVARVAAGGAAAIVVADVVAAAAATVVRVAIAMAATVAAKPTFRTS